jgi:glycosyltransferase involved in cell wall biosynthesis
MRRLLMVAFHYPPYEGGSGVHRTLKFSKYLPDNGWQPIILSAHPRAYPKIGERQIQEIPREAIVKRAFALDTARHLSIRGAYLRMMALPDPWITWWIGAVWCGLRLIRRYRPEIIWSTYPIATAHLIAFTLHRMTGIPWVADFRDSMTEDNYPPDPWSRRCYRLIEKKVVTNAARIVFTTESTRQMYVERYPALSADRCIVIPNGYDEEDYAGLSSLSKSDAVNGRPVRLVHAGVIYPEERDPRSFFRALRRLKAEGKVSAGTLRVDLRASGNEECYGALLSAMGIADIVRLLPALSHREAIQDCAAADGLLVLQAASCNHQIPAKVYEYLRLGRPILGLTPEGGDTALLLKLLGGATIIDLADEESLYRLIPGFLSSVRSGRHPLPDRRKVNCYSREYQTSQVARCLAELAPSKKRD